eukprot:TRINITY_DN30686_c0_g1_i1.p1 TRINITY_DN30686_c0_g1~~TRINITY_DN30686_c0_g1_i1.p1  ORF type:complete len:1252 (+),score=338.37 TRINITY_DN30686_c0_g1_i1:38-3757(+)
MASVQPKATQSAKRCFEPPSRSPGSEEGPDTNRDQVRMSVASDAKEMGNAALKSGNPKEAARLYKKGIQAITPVIEKSTAEGSGSGAAAAQELEVSLHLNLALACLRSEDFQSALEAARVALKRRPGDEKALYRRGVALARLGHVEDAAADFQELLKRGPNSDAQRELDALKSLKQEKKGLKEPSADKENQRPRPAEAAKRKKRVQNPNTAGLVFEEVAQLAINNAKTAKERGNVLLKCDKFAEAADLYEVGIDSLHAAVEVGLEECSNETAPGAIDSKRTLLQDTLDLQQALRLNLSLARFKADDYQAAAEAATAVLEKNPLHGKALYRRGLAMLKLGQREEAAKDLEALQAADLTPADLKQLAEAGYSKELGAASIGVSRKHKGGRPSLDSVWRTAFTKKGDKDQPGEPEPSSGSMSSAMPSFVSGAAAEATAEYSASTEPSSASTAPSGVRAAGMSKTPKAKRKHSKPSNHENASPASKEGVSTPDPEFDASATAARLAAAMGDDLEKEAHDPEQDLKLAMEAAAAAKSTGNSELQGGNLAAARASYEAGITHLLGAQAGILPEDSLTSLQKEARQLESTLQLNLSLCHLKSGDPENAAKAATEALRLQPRHPKGLFRRAQALAAHASLAEEQGEPVEAAPRMLRNMALSDLKELLEVEPSNAEARKEHAQVTKALKRCAPVAVNAEAEGKKEQNPFSGMFGDPQQIKERQRQAKERKREEELARLREAGNAAHRAGSYGEAEKCYTQALSLDPKSVPFLLNRAAARLMLESFEDGFQDCQHAAELDPSSGKAYVRGAKCLQARGDLAKAEAFLRSGFDKVSKQDQYDISAQVQTLRSAQKVMEEVGALLKTDLEGSPSEARYALRKLDEAEAAGQPAARLRALRLQALLQARDSSHAEEADRLSQLLLGEDPKSARTMFWRGSALLMNRKRGPAKTAFNDALGLERNATASTEESEEGGDDSEETPLLKAIRTRLERLTKADSLKDEGNRLLKERRWEEAAERYDEGCGASTGDAEMLGILHTNISAALRRVEERRGEAYKHAVKATEANPKYAKAFFRRGVLHYDEGRWSQSLKDFRKADELEPKLQGLDSWLKRARHAANEGSDRKNHYQALGLLCECEQEDIKKKYRQLARECHPDKVRSATESDKSAAEARFKAINEAHEVLSSEERRKEYDFGPPDVYQHGGFGGFGGFGGHGFDDFHGFPGAFHHGNANGGRFSRRGGFGHGGGFGGFF